MTRIGAFDLRDRKGRVEAEILDGGLRLTSEVEWRLKGPSERMLEIVQALGPIADRLDDGLALLRFGNAVGFFDVPHLGRLDVHSGKWSSATFNRMLRELTDEAAALPFAATSGSALPYDRSVPVSREVLYHAFVYLRHVVLEAEGEDNLAAAYRVLLADPHERLVRRDRLVEPERARAVGPRALEELVTGRQRLHKAPVGCTVPVAVALNGHLPERVREEVARRFVDTPENRFAKVFLAQVMWILDRMESRVEGPTRHLGAGARDRILHDTRRIRHELEPIARHGFWRSIGRLVAVPEASTVMQRRRGYREIYGHFAALRLASRVPLNARDVTRLLEAKDIATLYELWCFFRVVGALRQAGTPIAAEAVQYTDFDASVRHGYRVEWRSGLTAAYNPRFAQSETTRRSFSVPLRPDISVRVPDGPNAGLHLLDAKFKVDNLHELLGVNLDDDPDTLGRSSFTRADLYKMHTYRDAIRDAHSVWILYPGDDFAFYDAQLRATSIKAPAALPHPVEGVGAVPLRPEDHGGAGLTDLITTLLEGPR